MWDTFYFGATSKKFIKAFHYAFESYDFDALSPLLNTLNEDQKEFMKQQKLLVI